jgi:hypothetical protein
MVSPHSAQRYWSQWEAKLKPLVRAKGAKLVFPLRLSEEVDERSGTLTLVPPHPVLIHGAPDKASSTKDGRQLLLIDGAFELSTKQAAGQLLKPACSVTIYRAVEIPGESLRADLVDAIHFDMEVPFGDVNCKQFHPIFHAQRGQSLTRERFVRVLADAYHLGCDQIEINDGRDVLGAGYLRLPTPQLDLFSVMTMVAADFFCNAGDAQRDGDLDRHVADRRMSVERASVDRTNVRELFIDLLAFLSDEKNFARIGRSSSALYERIAKAEHLSAGHWYPEWHVGASR